MDYSGSGIDLAEVGCGVFDSGRMSFFNFRRKRTFFEALFVFYAAERLRRCMVSTVLYIQLTTYCICIDGIVSPKSLKTADQLNLGPN